jgi:hypothetical protein
MLRKILVVFFLLLPVFAMAQTTGCQVLIPALAGSYTGECRKGLANGEGIATGLDKYEGHFFKGKPDGKGIYTWADGSYFDGEWKNGLKEGQGKLVKGDSVITGFWKADVYKGKKQQPVYRVVTSRNVGRYTVTKSAEPGNGIRVKLLLGGRENSEVEPSLTYSSGMQFRNVGIYGVEGSSVPLDVSIDYTTPNQLHTTTYSVLFEIIINDPGVWVITLTNY